MSVPGIKLNNGSWLSAFLVKNAGSTEQRSTWGVTYTGTTLTPSSGLYSSPFTFSEWNGQYPAWSFKEYFVNGVITTSRTITLIDFANNLHLEAVLVSGSDTVSIRLQKSGTYVQVIGFR